MKADEWCRWCGRTAPCRRRECVLSEKADAMYPELLNRAMARELASGKAIDLADAGLLVEGTDEHPIVFQLPVFLGLGIDYCHSPTELWVWSIGRELSTGRVLAAFDTRFCDCEHFECLWLR